MTDRAPLFRPIQFGPFPHEMVSRTLRTEFDAGGIYFSARAQRHVWEKHTADYPLVVPRLKEIILTPSWIGQAPHRSDSIEFVRRLAILDPAQGDALVRHMALAAVSIEVDQWGNYRIQSVYTVSEEKVAARLTKNHLLVPKR